jgi:hypothetical protein
VPVITQFGDIPFRVKRSVSTGINVLFFKASIFRRVVEYTQV